MHAWMLIEYLLQVRPPPKELLSHDMAVVVDAAVAGSVQDAVDVEQQGNVEARALLQAVQRSLNPGANSRLRDVEAARQPAGRRRWQRKEHVPNRGAHRVQRGHSRAIAPGQNVRDLLLSATRSGGEFGRAPAQRLHSGAESLGDFGGIHEGGFAMDNSTVWTYSITNEARPRF